MSAQKIIVDKSAERAITPHEETKLHEFKLNVFQEIAYYFGLGTINPNIDEQSLQKNAKTLAIYMANLHYNDKETYEYYIEEMEQIVQLKNMGLNVHHFIIAFAEPDSPMMKKIDKIILASFGVNLQLEPNNIPVIVQDDETGTYRPC